MFWSTLILITLKRFFDSEPRVVPDVYITMLFANFNIEKRAWL